MDSTSVSFRRMRSKRRATGPEWAALLYRVFDGSCHLPFTILCERCRPRLHSFRPQKRKFYPRAACHRPIPLPPLLALQPLLRRAEVAARPTSERAGGGGTWVCVLVSLTENQMKQKRQYQYAYMVQSCFRRVWGGLAVERHNTTCTYQTDISVR